MTYDVSMKTTVTFVPGMFSPFINTFLGTYFIDQMEYLDKRAISYSVQPIHTEDSIEKNALVIKKNLEALGNVTAFCHSKGGIDLLHALITYPELKRRMRKIIFMQCPFYGTPLADVALSTGAGTFATKVLMKALFNGHISSVEELSEAKRKEYMDMNYSAIQEILKDLEVVCIGSAKIPEPGRFDSILKIPRDFIQLKFKKANDGMIPTTSAFIPGVRSFQMNDLDHASAVIRLTPQHFDRKTFSQKIFEGELR
jgi:hypothetical protein